MTDDPKDAGTCPACGGAVKELESGQGECVECGLALCAGEDDTADRVAAVDAAAGAVYSPGVNRWVWAIAVAAALLAACKSAEQLTREVLRATPQGRKYLPEFDRYRKMANVFMKYHEKGVLDDAGLLEILRDAGVIPGGRPKAGKTGGPVKPAGPKPFPVPRYKGAWRWPLDAGVVSSEFGKRWGKNHNGLDLAADMRVPVYASAPGEIVYAGNQVSGYGNLVVMRHDTATTTFYGHNDSLKVKTGDKVAANQVIALLGSTGHSTGPHVHFEIREKDKPLPPRARLPKSGF